MTTQMPTRRVHVATAESGARLYAVDRPPEELPQVQVRDLAAAWDSARAAALDQRWDSVRGFRFRRADGSWFELALLDVDVNCWAGAVELTVGMENEYGLSLCLRLIALVELLARARWTDPFFRIGRSGALLHPALLRAAAELRLTPEARFDDTSVQTHLATAAGAIRGERTNGGE